ncbi:hypothetical protein CEK28_10630 [Xenophilus sp. AP218F]|nr:hypothetical protein CEK28_10630 [Xenophilus sp. AP218F]
MKLLNSLICVLVFGVGGGIAYSNLLMGYPVAFPAWYQPYGVVAYIVLSWVAVGLMIATKSQVMATVLSLVFVGMWPMWVVYLPAELTTASIQHLLAAITLSCPIIHTAIGIARYAAEHSTSNTQNWSDRKYRYLSR